MRDVQQFKFWWKIIGVQRHFDMNFDVLCVAKYLEPHFDAFQCDKNIFFWKLLSLKNESKVGDLNGVIDCVAAGTGQIF